MLAEKITIGRHTLHWGTRTYLMGIINMTPDSFSEDGLLTPGKNTSTIQGEVLEKSIQQARQFVASGADILDIGGESTRPGASVISVEDEIARVLPILKAVTTELDVLISVDTYKSQVAEAALESGAHIVNDVWGFKVDKNLAKVVAQHKVPVILMHNRSSWANAEIKERLGGRYVGIPYDDLIEDIKRELLESVEIAKDAGIPDENIILDPGIGFGKTVEQNLELLDRSDEIRALGYPLLMGTSRKSFIGYTLDQPPGKRLEGTAATVAISIARGADIVRVHDVTFMSSVVRMADAIIRR